MKDGSQSTGAKISIGQLARRLPPRVADRRESVI